MNGFEDEAREVDLLEYWKVIVKRKWIIATFTGALVFFVAVFSFLATPIYKATTTLMVEEDSGRVLSIEDTFGYQNQVYRDLRTFNTQLRLIQSKSLSERVARKMNLIARPEFGAGKVNRKTLLAAARDILMLKWLGSGKKEVNGENRTRRDPNEGIARSVLSGIDVSPIRETKLVELSYSSTNPRLAAELINVLAEEFIDFTIEKRYQRTQQASDFLMEQIANLRDELRLQEEALQKYSADKGIIMLSDNESAVLSVYEQLATAHTSAIAERVNKEADFRELQNLDVDSLPQDVDNPLIQNLKDRYFQRRGEYQQKLKTYRQDYPEMIALGAEIDQMRSDLDSEIRKARETAEKSYRTAQEKENNLKRELDRQKNEMARMDQSAIQYKSLEINLNSDRNLLNTLEERQSTTQVSARLGGLKTSNITVIDPAEVPRSPVSPKKKMNIILAFLIGAFGGIGLCFVLEYLDNTVKGPEDAEKLTGLPSLGVIPYLPPEGIKKKKRYGYSSYRYKYSGGPTAGEDGQEEKEQNITEIDLINYHHPTFFISEDYRTIRTSILFSHADGPPKIISFTSALPGEGKTTSAANMAVAFSQLEQNILIIDADLRKPRLHKLFEVRNVVGLSAYLTGKIPFEEAVVDTRINNIWLMPSGPLPPNPTELLNSRKMKELMTGVRRDFDLVIIDTPPVMAVVDPVIVASISDGTVFVVQAGKTTEKPFVKAAEEMKKAKCKIIGVLFNEAKMNREGYYSDSYQYHYKYHYYGKEEETE
ncbi:MAG: polysaccharide biosynthesis tyrosine autokinase [Acidobacteriota bacterium]